MSTVLREYKYDQRTTVSALTCVQIDICGLFEKLNFFKTTKHGNKANIASDCLWKLH